MVTTDIEYDDPAKQIAWRSYIEGYDLGKNIESLNRHNVRTANANFERWWKRQME